MFFSLPGSGGRPTGRPDQEPVDRMCTRRAQRPFCLAGRPCGRPTEVSLLSGKDGRPEVGNGQIVTVGRSTGWSILTIISCQRLVFQRAYKLGFLFTVFTKNLESLFSDLTSIFAAIKKKFWALKFTFDLVFF